MERNRLLIGTLLLLSSCATSMTPMKVNNNLPELTQSKFISQTDLEEIESSNKCKYLVKGRSYTAPIGLTTKSDLKNAAKGIDEWVELDSGNSYVLRNYKWVTVDHIGTTQLHVEFDTMHCE
ncbi:hypothetical protein N6H18_17665 [Reichenbachiella agarivorans]|uniref:Lipoprotein n=1 Tax=Reichenbachiella agarivorans TaxID=2979464 RepID=A0ABY6CQ61_9BACT|nr:hypothetical protein [Reichenbachiella agarivorans]UXP32170.1 hypothetical protein N6H18_17665 [Reichenbachiella agarivorans]